MKKKYSLLFAVVLSVLIVTGGYSLAPTNAVIDGAYEVCLDTAISTGAGFDTLSGVDSTTLFTKALTFPGHAWQYVLVRDALTGGGTDSLKVQVMLDALDGSGNLLTRTIVDSITAAAGEAFLLPIGGTSFGIKYRVKLVGYTDNGGQVIINRMHLYKRRVAIKDLGPSR